MTRSHALSRRTVLGTLAAGGVYVPLDPGFPVDRLRHMLAAADVRVVACVLVGFEHEECELRVVRELLGHAAQLLVEAGGVAAAAVDEIAVERVRQRMKSIDVGHKAERGLRTAGRRG